MAIIGTLLKNRRAGTTHLAWNQPSLAGPETLELASTAFDHEAAIPREHAGKRAHGRNLSPDLTWGEVPEGTAQLLLVIEDVDAPTGKPFVHCVALIEPTLNGVDTGALSAQGPATGVRVLRSTMGRGYLGPEPIKGHGPHRYVFQVFALGDEVTAAPGGADLDKAKPRDLIAAVTAPVLARGRLDGEYER